MSLSLRMPIVAETQSDVLFTGFLQPSVDVSIRVLSPRRLAECAFSHFVVSVGERVLRGGLLAHLSGPDFAVRVEQERSMVHLLESQLSDCRRTALNAPGPSAQLSIDGAITRLEQAKANLLAWNLALKQLEIRSPIDGIVAELKTPASLTSETVIARIVQADTLTLVIAVPMGTKMPVLGSSIALSVGSRLVSAMINSVAPTVDSDGLLHLHIDIPNDKSPIPAGIQVRGTISVGARTGCFIPRSAIVSSAGKSSVYVSAIEGVVARPVRVLSDPSAADEVEVAGILNSDPIITDPLAWLANNYIGSGSIDE